jgi:hypothetical protein
MPAPVARAASRRAGAQAAAAPRERQLHLALELLQEKAPVLAVPRRQRPRPGADRGGAARAAGPRRRRRRVAPWGDERARRRRCRG